MPSASRRLPYTLRKLVRSPVFTLVSVFTLAVGIGANTAIFSVVNGVLLEPLPFRDAGSLVGVWHTAPGLGFDEVNMSPAMYVTYRDDGRVFEDIGMWDNGQAAITGIEEAEQVESMTVTDAIFPLLGAQAAVGRLFTAEDDAPDAPRTVVLGWSYWQTRFGGERSAIGRTLRVNGREWTIIGVLPERFRFLRFDPAVYLPFRLDRSSLFVGNFSYQSLARLRPGTTIAQANADMNRLIPVTAERFGGRGVTLNMLREARFAAAVRPLKQDVVGDIGNVLWVLLGTVGLVLLIACANVANLFLVRAEGRAREMAVRTAMGASRGRIAGQLLAESALLGLAGGLAGLGLAALGLRVLVRLAPDNLPRIEQIGINVDVLLFTLVISLFAGLLFGLIPALRVRSTRLAAVLREGGRGSSEGRERHAVRGVIATAEVALALVLIVGAGLMVRSFQALRQVQPGFQQPSEVLTVHITVPTAEVAEAERVVAMYEQILARLAALPGVVSAGASWAPMSGLDSNDPIHVEDRPTPPDQLPPIRRYKWMAGDWFATMQNPVLAGRTITWADIHSRANVVVVTENFAREYWADAASAVGKRVRHAPDSPWREIVGVVADERDDGVGEDPVAVVYWPIAVDSFWDSSFFVQRTMGFALRTAARDPMSLVPAVREAVWSVNRNLPLFDVRTLDEVLDRSMARTSFTLVMLGIAAAVALLLGVIGIYGVIAYIVAHRTREIGVRLALGASQASIRRLVLRQGAVYALAGTAIGLVVAAGLTRLMASLLHGVRASDPLTYVGAALAVAAVALLASLLPALRASAVDPNTALRWEA